MTHITIGSRGSQLALWQSRWVASELQQRGFTTSIEVVKTTGDKITGVPLSQIGAAKGLFTKELEDALLDGSIDIAVHSLKDMPTELPSRLILAATPAREDARDAIIGKTLQQLSHGAKVGTSSLRRTSQLRHVRPDLIIESVRGNIDTRLRKLDEGQYDAILLAAAGLRRLGWADRIAELIPVETMCPAVGQGALAIEAKEDEPKPSAEEAEEAAPEPKEVPVAEPKPVTRPRPVVKPAPRPAPEPQPQSAPRPKPSTSSLYMDRK